MSRALQVVATALAALALAGTAGAGGGEPAFLGPTIANPSVAPDFALRDQRGTLVRLSSERGRVVAVTFLYTHCPLECPLTAVHLNEALERLGAQRTQTRVLAVSVDPVGDTRRAAARFVRTHGLLPQFHYLTGTAASLRPVWRRYGLRTTPAGTRVDHTLFILLVDRSGKARVIDDATAQPAAIAHDLRLLLGGA